MSALLLAVFAESSGHDVSGAGDDSDAIRQRDAEARAAERVLLERLRRGEESAFRELFDAYFARLSRFAAGITHARESADDIAQDVLAWVWDQRATWNPEHALKTYLFAATRNRALNERAHHGVRARTSELLAESLTHDASRSDVVDRLAAHTMIEALQHAVDALPERRRTALRLRYEEGLTYPAIAQILGVSVKSAEQLVMLTVQALRKTLHRFRR